MKFCPVVLEICRGQVYGSRKERGRIRIIKIKIRNGAKTISLQMLSESYIVRNNAVFWFIPNVKNEKF
jgi:hypothetical protein